MKINIKKENQLDTLISHLNDNLNHFIFNEVVGITLNGGLSRGYGDHLSEIDITIYLKHDHYVLYTEGHYDITEGICVINDQLYDVKIADYDHELKRNFSIETELWDLNHAKILYDPEHLINPLLELKLAQSVADSDAGGYMFSSWWFINLACDIWLYREDAFQGHMMLNEAAKALLKSLYVINGQYVPHEKWLTHFVQNLDDLPVDYNTLMKQLFSTGDLSLESLKIRQKHMIDIYNLINDKAGYDISKGSFHNKVMSVIKEETYTIDEFEEQFGLRTIHSDPFCKFIKRKDDTIFVSVDSLLRLKPNEMYEWHYSVVESVQKTL